MGIAKNSNQNLTGYISYNGWTFQPPRFSMKSRMRPKMSEDGRTTVANIYQFFVRAIVSDDPGGAAAHMQFSGQGSGYTGGSAGSPGSVTALTNDTFNARSNLQSIRACLSKNGGQLRIFGMGWDLTVNGGSNTSLYDTDYGPKTLDLQINQIGNGVIHEVTWVFEVTLPECFSETGAGHADQTQKTGGAFDKSYISFPYFVRGTSSFAYLEQLSFSVRFVISVGGLTTRIISGEFAIPLNRADVIGAGGHAELTTTADDLFDEIQPEIPAGFQRMQREREISPDMKKIRFQIVDQELPSENNFPPGVVDMRCSHAVRVDNKIFPGPMPIFCALMGFIEVAKGQSKGLAFNKLLLIIQQRITIAKAAWLANNGPRPNTSQIPVILTGIEIREDLYGPRRIEFRINYIVNPGTNRTDFYTDIIGTTGLFVPVVDTDWTTWGQSLVDGEIWRNTGYANLKFTPDNAPIVGPCDGTPFANLSEPESPPASSDNASSLATGCPPTGFDYIKWENKVETSGTPTTVTTTPMSTDVGDTLTTKTGGQYTDVDETTYFVNTQVTSRSGGSKITPRSQNVRPTSALTVCFVGNAVRLGKPPEPPDITIDPKVVALLTAKKLVPAGPPGSWNTRVGALGNCPIYAGGWSYCYDIVGDYSDTDIADFLKRLQDIVGDTPSDTDGNKLGGKSN